MLVKASPWLSVHQNCERERTVSISRNAQQFVEHRSCSTQPLNNKISIRSWGYRLPSTKRKSLSNAVESPPPLCPMNSFVPLGNTQGLPRRLISSQHLLSSSHLRTAARPPLINSSSDRPLPAPPFESPLVLAPTSTRPFCSCCCCCCCCL